MTHHLSPMTLLIVVIAILGFVVALFTYAPAYLAYADKPVKSDVIVLFVGPDYEARLKEARKLIEEGYAQHLIVPVYGTMYGHSILTNPAHSGTGPTNLINIANPTNKTIYPHYFGDTHVEVLEAKKMMDKAGLKSAIFVSSPFHMRRINIIANKVFKGRYGKFTFVPTRYEKKYSEFWMFHNNDISNVVSEYAKIVWFFASGLEVIGHR